MKTWVVTWHQRDSQTFRLTSVTTEEVEEAIDKVKDLIEGKPIEIMDARFLDWDLDWYPKSFPWSLDGLMKMAMRIGEMDVIQGFDDLVMEMAAQRCGHKRVGHRLKVEVDPVLERARSGDKQAMKELTGMG